MKVNDYTRGAVKTYLLQALRIMDDVEDVSGAMSSIYAALKILEIGIAEG